MGKRYPSLWQDMPTSLRPMSPEEDEDEDEEKEKKRRHPMESCS
jgi:hypothetical protein